MSGCPVGRRVGRPASAPRALALGVVVLVAAGVPGATAAQSRVESAVDTTQATLGDHVTLTVTVTHPAGSRVAWPDSLSLAPFEVLGVQAAPDVARGDTVVSTARVTVAPFQLGDLELPSFQVPVEGPGAAVDTLATDAFTVRVVSVGGGEGGDIRDIRGPLSIPLSVLRVLLWASLFLAVLALGLWGARRLRRRGSGAAPATAPAGPPPRPPHEVALEALDRLEASPLLERGEVKEYHIQAADILRVYVAGRFGVGAPEMTTDEVLAGLPSAGVEGQDREDLRRFLEPCDMVKFAKLRPAPDAARAILALGRRWVEATMPHAEGMGADAEAETTQGDADAPDALAASDASEGAV